MKDEEKRKLIKYYSYIDGESKFFCITNINFNGAYDIIEKYLTDGFGFIPINRGYNFTVGFQKDDFIFRRTFDDIDGDFCFSSFDGKIETKEYYEKLEELVKNLVDKLIDNGALLNLKD